MNNRVIDPSTHSWVFEIVIINIAICSLGSDWPVFRAFYPHSFHLSLFYRGPYSTV